MQKQYDRQRTFLSLTGYNKPYKNYRFFKQ
jgi:hypothetical protein